MTDRRHHDVPGVDRAQGRSLPSVVVVTGGGGGERTLASCDRSSGLAVPASKVDCFSGSILHLIRSVKHSDSKHEWPLVRLMLNDNLKLYQLCRYKSFPDHHHHSLQAILSLMTRRHLSFFSGPKQQHILFIFTPRRSRLLPQSRTQYVRPYVGTSARNRGHRA